MPPAAPSASVAASSSSALRAFSITAAPSSASWVAVASPMPLLAPTTTATAPSNLFSSRVISSLSDWLWEDAGGAQPRLGVRVDIELRQ